MAKYLVEFIGTFFLVLVIGLTVIAGSPLAPLAIGAVLIALVYAGGPISAAHYNPAVTVAFRLIGRLPHAEITPYMIAQFAGSALAAVVSLYLTEASLTPNDIDIPRALLTEFLFTFLMVFVILNVANVKTKDGDSNSYYGLAIGTVVMAIAMAGSSISGGAYNPAVALGACIMGWIDFANIWVYWLSNFAAALAASFVFKTLSPKA